MRRTKIPWCDYTINPVKGLCPMACEYCYARRMYKRFKWNPEIRFEPEILLDLSVVPNGSKVFIGSTIELFHKDTIQWMPYILDCIKRAPWQTSILLTKQPQNLIGFEFPDNCWVLVSATNQTQYNAGIVGLSVVKARVKGFSIEPFLGEIYPEGAYDLSEADWLIIGSQTQPTKHPRRECVERILLRADEANIPVFIKEPLASHINIQRQEFPSVESDIKL